MTKRDAEPTNPLRIGRSLQQANVIYSVMRPKIDHLQNKVCSVILADPTYIELEDLIVYLNT